jgi:PEP-CTERM motif
MRVRNTFKLTALALGAAIMVSSVPAQAAYVINIVQSGPNVVATGAGSINLAGLSGPGTSSSTGSSLNPVFGIAAIGSGGALDIYSFVSSGMPANFGTGGLQFSSTSNGNTVAIGSSVIFVPRSYISGTSLGTSTATWTNTTFALLGLRPGTYIWTWGNGATTDSSTLHITAPPVPEPATWTSMLFGLGLTAFALRRKKYISSATN